MSEASKRVAQAAQDARSNDDLVGGGGMDPFYPFELPLDSPLDEETADEQASTQLGPWESRRRDADD
jgi:hypothetical protein